ncbi:non-ribosomal peptide synthetase, partial [Paenibacillus sp. MMS18-CY102]|uniref:non-ribosomal peptide synthetase n=1 Tax=Paenibacillus sp. MMS18-CY102 TaxID=2682849 RepID=UPI001365E36F
VRLVKNTNYAELNEHTRILQTGAIVFDASTFEIWGALLNGGRLYLEPNDVILDATKLKKTIQQYGITTMWLTSPLFNQLSQQDSKLFAGVQTLIVGGDVLSVPHINRVLQHHPGLRIINGYGPTENTTFSTTHEIKEEQTGAVPIGRPIHNSTAYVVDPFMNLVPIGAWGELIVGGDGVARGYVNKPELTDEKFIPNPFRPGERSYRTGDLARWRADGTLEYKGRIDEQVKIRGYRIELGEIETQLMKLEAIQEAVVIAREDETGQKHLCAYFVAEEELTVSDLRTLLSEELPSYMIPSFFVPMEQIPLNVNGKVDRKALPAPEGSMQTGTEYVAPRTPMEAQLAQIWQEVLGLERIGMKDNFFDVGGHSLRATTLVAKMHKAMGIEMPLREVFQYSTIEQMAEVISGKEQHTYGSIPVIEESTYYPVSSAQKRMYILSQLEGGELSYNMPGIFTVDGPIDRERLEEAFRNLIRRHEALRTGIELVNGEPVQRVHEDVEFAVAYTQASEEEVEGLYRQFVRVFDLSHAPLLRVGLIECKPDRHVLLIDMHHIISDGTSVGIMVQEFVQLYHGVELTPLRIQYKDYAAWQQAEVQSERMKQQEAYWLEVCSGEIPVLDLPTDYARPPVKSFEGNTFEFVIDKQRSEGLRQLATQTGTTLYMVLLSAYTTLLSKYSGQEDIIVGTPIAGRAHADLQQTLGMFVNTLAMRNAPSGEKLFHAYVQEVKENALRAYENQDYPFEELVNKLDVARDVSRNPLFDTMFILQNTEQSELSIGDLKCIPYPLEHHVAKFDLTFNLVEEAEGIVCSIEYASSLYKRETVERMAQHFKQLIDVIVKDPQTKLSAIEMITPDEKTQILEVFNDTATDYPRDKTIHQLFEEQVERTPEQVAVVYEGSQLTYRELNEKANRLARTLRAEGIQPDQPIGILVERSLEMMVGLLGILKAGGAYVPITPVYPEERIRYILEDSGAKQLLVQSRFKESVAFTGTTLVLDDALFDKEDGSNLATLTGPRHLANLFYTSGSTGKPKGVMVEHRNVVRLVKSTNYAELNEHTRILQAGSIVFDASTFEIWGALLNGGRLYLEPKDVILDAMKLKKTIQQHGITTLQLVTPLFNQLSQQDSKLFEGVQTLIIGGDVLSVPHVNRVLQHHPGLRIINAYGPTENATNSTTHEIKEEQTATVPIGRPIHNSTAYVVDPFMNLAPIGAWGELIVGGDGVTRGYLNKPELTEEKFIPNPFRPRERIYRTGDLARWRSDGTLEYKGRIDHQVKIRGYRIELGEIETQLMKLEAVQEAVVTAREDETGQKHLCAYFVAEEELAVRDLRTLLSEKLPSYMVPSYFIQMDKMPLSPNGKIDRKALPASEGSSFTGTEYVAPRTEVERTLVSIWQAVLGVKSVGIMDKFFDLGGDSIKSIQVSSRMLQAGYKIEMKDMFIYPTVASLSPHVQLSNRVAEQGEIKGAAGLTPIQHWFFENQLTDLHHFNQAILLYREQGFDEIALRETMTRVTEHHDALRMVFHKGERGYEARNRGVNEGELYSLEVVDCRRDEVDTARMIETKANDIQASIDLSEGPLVKVGLFRCADGDHLLIAIHHLVVDGVSWRILLEDISTGYKQAEMGRPIQLPQKTDSFQTWAEHLALYANHTEIEHESVFWQSIEQAGGTPLPKDDDEQKKTLLRDSETVTVQWTEQETDLLLKQAHRAYNTEVTDLLLTALGAAIHIWSGIEQVLVNLEGHGRESILPDIDITRTVGWFTSQYPVMLTIGQDQDVSQRIKQTKEALRQIPQKGIGYGILKYMSAFGEGIDWKAEPEISFNYLGQFDQDLNQHAIELSRYSSGVAVNENTAIKYALDINGMISQGSLSLTIDYSAHAYRRETMERFTELFKTSLQEVIAHCMTKERPEPTPSDLLRKGLTIEELEQIIAQTCHLGEIENICALTPMQKGMMFHNLLDPQSGVYFENATFDLVGTFDEELFGESLKVLVKRYQVFRTNFISGREEPLQIIFRNKKAGFYVEDLRQMNEAQRKEYINKFTREDKARGFDLAQGELMRVSILRTGEETYHFIWSFHHILMDGWCLSLLTQEVFYTYFALVGQREPKLAPVTPYSRYIEWLEQQDNEEASRYWGEYVAGYEQQTLLPTANRQNKVEGYLAEELICSAGRELTDQMRKVARQHQVTLYTLLQSAWGIVLQKYNGNQDVVFGSVVSGRPAEIPGIESMIGLFINTVPVRIRTEPGATFAEAMRWNQEQATATRAYDTYPLYDIQNLTEQKQGLINHIMVFENYPVQQKVEQLGSHDQASFTIANVEMNEQTNYDFNLIVLPGEELHLCYKYNALVYDQTSVERIQGHLIHVLEQIVNNPNICVNDLELVTEVEKTQILEVFNDTVTDYPRDKTIHQLFEEQVKHMPEQVAVVYEGSQLTYGELNEKANRLARRLRAEGVQPDQPVGILVE